MLQGARPKAAEPGPWMPDEQVYAVPRFLAIPGLVAVLTKWSYREHEHVHSRQAWSSLRQAFRKVSAVRSSASSCDWMRVYTYW